MQAVPILQQFHMGLSGAFTVYSILAGKLYKDDVCHIIMTYGMTDLSKSAFEQSLLSP
jgi:hypothetical protein